MDQYLPTHPSPNSTLTMTGHLGQNVRLGEGGRRVYQNETKKDYKRQTWGGIFPAAEAVTHLLKYNCKSNSQSVTKFESLTALSPHKTVKTATVLFNRPCS